jgi:BON domain
VPLGLLASHLQLSAVMRHPLAALLLLGVLLGGCALAGRTFGTYVDDKMITGSVKRGLVTEHPRSLKGVTVDTYEGTVYLSGEVQTTAQKAEAEAAAWRVDGVEQVINDLRVRTDSAVSASPRTTEPSPLQERLPGLRRIDPAPPGAPGLAYDAAGTIVATIFVRPLRDLSINGFEEVGATVRPITHISLYPVPAGAGQPEALVTIVLWHVSPAAAAALR